MEDPFPLPFLDLVLDIVARHDMYSFMDGYSGYNQIKMAKDDKEKIAFMYQNGEHMLIMLCHLAYVMPQLPFKRL
jgi:translation elongation factor P/translation initiation factor 5A